MKAFALLPALLVIGCDRLSERIWNCASIPLSVIKIADTGQRVAEIIPARSFTASMKGGVQTVALQQRRGARLATIWVRDGPPASSPASSADEACAGRSTGIVAEQF